MAHLLAQPPNYRIITYASNRHLGRIAAVVARMRSLGPAPPDMLQPLAWLISPAHTPVMALCGEPRKRDGEPCMNRVRNPELPCWRHGGPRASATGSRQITRPRTTASPGRKPVTRNPAWEPIAWHAPALASSHRQQPVQPPPHQTHDRVEEAARFCADTLSEGWKDAVADRITGYAQATWKRLSRSRRKHNCKELARMAREILNAKDQIHKLAGELIGEVVVAKGTALAFTEELVSNIPLSPIDAKMTTVARGIQITGVLLCVIENRDLTKCECFIDLALAETKERVNQILVAAMSDWTCLARFIPEPSYAQNP